MHQAPGSDRHARNGRSFFLAHGDGCLRLDDLAGGSGIEGIDATVGDAHAPVWNQRRHRDKDVQAVIHPGVETGGNGVWLAPVDLGRR